LGRIDDEANERERTGPNREVERRGMAAATLLESSSEMELDVPSSSK